MHHDWWPGFRGFQTKVRVLPVKGDPLLNSAFTYLNHYLTKYRIKLIRPAAMATQSSFLVVAVAVDRDVLAINSPKPPKTIAAMPMNKGW